MSENTKVILEPTPEGNILIFQCPHCLEIVEVLESCIFCKIFRHAVFKDTMQQINPHTPKTECDLLVEENRVYGCAKPFQIFLDGNDSSFSCAETKFAPRTKYRVEICDYI